MSEALRELYAGRVYPPMSHPASHPAVVGVHGRLAGLAPVNPDGMRVLEIGCAGGWNLLPIAAAFPGAECVGVDFSAPAIDEARGLAAAAGLANARFECADFADWQGEGFDFVIAHGVFSWVADQAKRRLLESCRTALARGGLAYISFNTDPGWALRRPLAEVVRALAGRPGFGATPDEVLAGIDGALDGAGSAFAVLLREIARDMRAKGELLAFDDLAPVCDPVTVAQFVTWAGQSGLRWLGEAALADQLPAGLPPRGEQWLAPAAGDPLLAAQLADLLGGRTHRAAVLARADAGTPAPVSSQVVLDLCVRPLAGAAQSGGRLELLDADGAVRARVREPLARDWFLALAGCAPACVPVGEVLERVGERRRGDLSNELPRIARLLLDAARAGLLELRTEPLRYPAEVPERPLLNPLRQLAVERGHPLVDAWHTPCSFPAEQHRLLRLIDGTRTAAELAALAHLHHPHLDFPRWIAHLAGRGLLEGARPAPACPA